MAARILSTALLMATAALARTDLQGCTYFDSVVKPESYAAYATRVWYVPDSGEICELLDCGGGRAPPKTTVPGCGSYEGTETYSPRYLDPKTLGGQAPETTTAAGAATSSAADASEALTTEAPSTSTVADEEDEETATKSASAESPAETSSSAAADAPSNTQTTAGPEITTSARPRDSAANSGTPAATTGAAASTSSVPDSAAAALPVGAAMGSWVVAGVAVWAGMM